MPDQAPTSPKRRYEMPFLLMAGMGFSAFFSAVWALVSLLMIPITLFGGNYTVNGVPATRAEFWQASAPVFLGVGAVGVLSGAIAYTLWAERPVSRALMMGFWALSGLVAAISLAWSGEVGAMLGGLAETAVLAAVAYWYLYVKPNVKAYYSALAVAVQPASTANEPGAAPSGA
ncbi:MAG TPA: hypothetical protein VFL97_09200 [Nitrococcus sp.]|nr:hypothetical protein [Nitrococcus sp.]